MFAPNTCSFSGRSRVTFIPFKSRNTHWLRTPKIDPMKPRSKKWFQFSRPKIQKTATGSKITRSTLTQLLTDLAYSRSTNLINRPNCKL